MPVFSEHHESHFTASETVRDVVIGMSDGLTVPFALAAGISGAIASSKIVVTAGIAEVAAGAIAMALGGYLAARTDQEHYRSELAREHREIATIPDAERGEVALILASYGLSGQTLHDAVEMIAREPDQWVNFMMRLELGLDEPDPKRALASGATIGGSYVVGGIVPLVPYMFAPNAGEALVVSAIVTMIALAIFGGVKGALTGIPWLRSAFQTVLIGGVASGVAFGLAKLVQGH
ncbi:MAG: VIT1/CCC1 transporter family protein [bacterium]|nr:VIT1/CCC1 transporter family protein [bacterium]